MMKRSLILVLSLLMLVLCIPALAESTDWNYDANYAILRGYDGDARLYLSCGETFSAEAGRTILSFIEIAPDEYLVEVRHLTPATGVQ